jgi:hypothetical protein
VAALTEHFEFVTDPADAMPAREGAEGTEVAATPPRQASALAGPMPQAAPAAPSD